ncbi:MAG TPA: mevalonate kinase [Candidatus Hodarchaeales archaeon]|nr:mevalonate kinase [Candidatus Hodarchaeales archaeon]
MASAPAKVILVGEHAVVYGQPAIAVAVNLRAIVNATSGSQAISNPTIHIVANDLGAEKTLPLRWEVTTTNPQENKVFQATLKICQELKNRLNIDWTHSIELEISSNVPRGAGLGSSAAVSVASTVALAKLLGKDLVANKDFDLIWQVSFEAEKIHHGTPSGIDNAVSTYGGGILYQRPNITPFPLSSFHLVIGDTRKERSSLDIVLGLRSRREKHPQMYDPVFEQVGKVVAQAKEALQANPVDTNVLGELFNINHGLLSAMGVSSAELESLIWASRRAGALGAKLTGSGGGGAMIALVRDNDTNGVTNAIRGAGGSPLVVSVDPEGVKLGK